MNWLWRALLGDTPVPQCGIPQDEEFGAKLDPRSGAAREPEPKSSQNKVR